MNKIKFEDLENWVGKPVYDDSDNKWRILKGYAALLEGNTILHYVAFTDSDGTYRWKGQLYDGSKQTV